MKNFHFFTCFNTRENRPLVSGLLLVIALFLAGPELSAQDKVMDFSMPSATDSTLVRLSDFGGKVILINWFRTKCRHSERETPKLVDLYKKFRDKGLVIFGISDDTSDSVGAVAGYIEKHGITWPVVLNDQGEFMKEIRPMGSGNTPENYMVSRDGSLTYLSLDRNPESWTILSEAVALAINQKEPAVNPIPLREIKEAPPFSLSDMKRKTVNFSDFKGKPLVVNFFFSQTCEWTGDIFQKIHDDFSSRGLHVIGINLYDKEPDIKNCIDKYGVTYPILKADPKVLQEWVGENVGWATLFVDKEGKIFKKIVSKIRNGIEDVVFQKYAEYILNQ